MIAEALVQALQTRVDELEKENEELRRDNARYANAHHVLMLERAELLQKENG